MKRYPSYKDSGISWIGLIPEHWGIEKIASHFDERRTKVSDKDYAPLSVTKDGIVPQLEDAAKTDNGDNRKLVRTGDFVVNSRSDRKSSCGVSPYDGSVSLINIVLVPRDLNKSFIHYLFRSNNYVEEFYRNGRGIVADLWTTRYSEMKNIMLPIPQNDEQGAIVRFIEDKVKKIDRYVSEKQRQVAALDELRQAEIANAVTRGLNPDAPLRDSGISLIGQIPKHWLVVKMGRLVTKVGSGSTPTGGATVYVKSGINFIRSQNVYFNGMKMDEVVHITREIDEKMKGTRLKSGDILLNITGGSIGRCYCIDDTILPANVNQHVCIIRPNDKISNWFLKYYIESTAGQNQVFLMQKGDREGLSAESIRAFSVIYPPLAEQQAIVEYLDKKTADIDRLKSEILKEIELLKEYKQRLISDAVTGQIDVRDYIPTTCED